MSHNHYLRPQFHFSPRKNWMNDPNGCVYHNGLYHLFFQYHPEGIEWGPMHWGHAVSTNLLMWEEKDIALYPDEDLGMIFSGSGIVDKKNLSGFFPESEGLIFFYSSHKEEGAKILQQQCIAFSHDDGQTFEKYKGNPVLKNPGIPDFRDPKVVYHPDSGSWIMAVAAGHQIDLFSSRNFLNWTRETSFSRHMSNPDKGWECPDLFPMTHPDDPDLLVWILTISLQVSTESPTQIYFTDEFDGHEFTPFENDNYKVADYGLDFYAAQSWSNIPDKKTVWIGWCNNWNYAAKTPDTCLWRGAMTVPRELILKKDRSGFILSQKPVKSIETLRKSTGSFSKHTLTSHAEFNLDDTDLWDFSLKGIDCSDNGITEITFHWDNGEALSLIISERSILLDRNRCGSLFSGGSWNRIEAPLSIHSTLTDCRILLDRGIIEIFADNGKICMANQILPEGKLTKMRISPAGRIDEIKGFPLMSIWDGREAILK